MKVLQINSVYNNGSTGKIVKNIHDFLKQQNIESIVCYGRGTVVNDKNVYKICGEIYSKINNMFTHISGIMYGGCRYSTKRLIHIIEMENPDIVHIQCINGYFVNIYKVIAYLKEQNIPTVLTLHADFMFTGNCGHALDCDKWKIGCGKCPRLKKETKSIFFDRTHISWLRLKNAFNGFRKLKVVSVSPWLMGRAKDSPILAEQDHCVIYNGIDTGIFHPEKTHRLRTELSLLNFEKVALHVTPYFTDDPLHLKGGYYLLELAKKMRDIKFIVVGDYTVNCEIPTNILFLGKINDQTKLAQLYTLADVTVLTSKRESFSMVCAESLCCGTPVVGFQAGGPEQISLPEYSCFSEYGNLNILEKNIRRMITFKHSKDISTKASMHYSIDKMGNEYEQCYKSLLEDEN